MADDIDDTAILEKVADDTAIVGKTLEREYGGSHPQNVHIEHFFLLLGTEIVEKTHKIFTELDKKWDAVEEEWPELFFSTCKFLKIDQYETERYERRGSMRLFECRC